MCKEKMAWYRPPLSIPNLSSQQDYTTENLNRQPANWGLFAGLLSLPAVYFVRGSPVDQIRTVSDEENTLMSDPDSYDYKAFTVSMQGSGLAELAAGRFLKIILANCLKGHLRGTSRSENS